MIDYTQELSLDFTCTLSATVHRKVELSYIWAQIALCKLTMGADLTVVNSICSLGISKYKGRQLLLHGRNSAVFA